MPVANRVETVHSALSLVLAGEGMAIVPACARLGCRPASCSGPSLTPTMPWTSRLAGGGFSQSAGAEFPQCAEKAIRQA